MMRQLLTKCSHVMYGILVYMILAIALGSMVSKAFFALFLLPVIVYVIVKIFRGDMNWSERIPYRFLWWGIAVLGTLIMFYLAYEIRVQSLSWDWGKVIRSASERVLTGSLADEAYFARYPNNQIWYCVLVVFFSMIKRMMPAAGLSEFYLFTIALGCLMVCLTILLFHHVAMLLWGEKKAFFAGALLWLCFPLFMWAPYAYTDTSGMLVLMLLLYIAVKEKKEENAPKKIVYGICFGVVAAFAYLLKVTVFIFAIAVMITFFLQNRDWRRVGIGFLIAAISFGGSTIVWQAGMHQILNLEEQQYDQNELPLTHWVMMSMRYGGYVQEDVDYTMSFPSYQEKKEANIKEIRKRLQEKGPVGCMKLFFVDKQIRTWGDAAFSGCDYLSREPENPDGFWEKFVTQEGKWNWLLLLYLYLYYGIILIGMLLGVVLPWRENKQGQELMAARVTMLGIAVLMTIWECNSRYIVLFLPLMVLLSCDGWRFLRGRFLCSQSERRK